MASTAALDAMIAELEKKRDEYRDPIEGLSDLAQLKWQVPGTLDAIGKAGTRYAANRSAVVVALNALLILRDGKDDKGVDLGIDYPELPTIELNQEQYREASGQEATITAALSHIKAAEAQKIDVELGQAVPS